MPRQFVCKGIGIRENRLLRTMSSHHFVREGQEPALLITEAVDFALAEPLLEWAPHVIVMEEALGAVLTWGIKIDTVIASPSTEAELQNLLAHQAPIQIIVQSTGDLLENALLYLRTAREHAVNILLRDAKPAFSKMALFNPSLQLSLITPDLRWSWFSSKYQKWHPAGALLRVEGTENIEADGLEKNPEGFTVVQEGVVVLNHPGGFWVGEVHGLK